ncbi:SIR2 family NAD-dependent protein deacylase [Natronobeatus ordinarius]|uniref:SIR2 family NAD-dependent protein deacylase n=1 Tax=Natronobeatus ordinarius TaxID=2963433 RepID=UPI0020CCC8C1|nr:Sir2 family NAD-dependent protein deacetylase [Natronobeatus ordinarius]
MDDLERLAEEIREADTVVALTGAGISAPSGVPTFRGDDGVWDRFEEGQFTYGRFQRDPAGFWTDRLELYETMFGDGYEPNAAHETLAELACDGHLDAIATQNTDGLHAQAFETVTDSDVDDKDDSSADLLELHGNAHRVRCVDCGRRQSNEPILERVREGELPPRCACGGVYKPDVVLFGERLSAATLQRSRQLARESDVFLAIGSSLVVEPAASLPRQAARTGGSLAIVNLEATPCDGDATAVFRDDVTEALPRLRDAVTARE